MRVLISLFLSASFLGEGASFREEMGFHSEANLKEIKLKIFRSATS